MYDDLVYTSVDMIQKNIISDDMIQKLLDLINTGTKDNIDLAFVLAESQNIDLDTIAQNEYGELCTFILGGRGKTSTIKQKLRRTFLKIARWNDKWKWYNITSIVDKLEKIPAKIGDFPHIKILTFFNTVNTIQELPPEIGKLKNLEELNLANTQIRFLPPEIGQLKQLKKLDLRETFITELPAEIGQLENITHLYLGTKGTKFNIEKLPNELSNLKNLEVLILQNTNCLQLPYLSKMSKLTSLNLQNTALKELPKHIYEFPSLEALFLSETSINELSSDIGKLKYLKRLWLNGTNITELPIEIANLEMLNDLKLPKICKIPAAVKKMTKKYGTKIS